MTTEPRKTGPKAKFVSDAQGKPIAGLYRTEKQHKSGDGTFIQYYTKDKGRYLIRSKQSI